MRAWGLQDEPGIAPVPRPRRGPGLLRGVAGEARHPRVRDRRRRGEGRRVRPPAGARLHVEVPALGHRLQVPGAAGDHGRARDRGPGGADGQAHAGGPPRPRVPGRLTVARATLHNEEEVARKDVRVGDTVADREGRGRHPQGRAGGGGEAAGRAPRPGRRPRRVPCAAPSWCKPEGEVDRRCPNSSCPAQIEQRLQHFARAHGHGHRRAGRRASCTSSWRRGSSATSRASTASTWTTLVGLERMGEKSAAEPAGPDRGAASRASCAGCSSAWVSDSWGSGRPCSWRGTSGSLDALGAATVEEIDAIYEIGPAVAQSVHDWFQSEANRRLVRAAEGGRRAHRGAGGARPAAQSFQGMQIVLTGGSAKA